MRRTKRKEFLLYAGIGLMTLVVSASTLVFLVEIVEVPSSFAFGIQWVFTTLLNYVINSLVTYRTRPSFRPGAKFVGIKLGLYVGQQVGFNKLITYWAYPIAFLAVAFAAFLVGFVVNRLLVFSHVLQKGVDEKHEGGPELPLL